MSATLEQCRVWLNYANCRAWLHVIRSVESSDDDSAYTVINGGGHFTAPPWAHPWPEGTPTTQGGKAAGAYQFLPSTWQRVAAALDLPDFSPESQDIGAVYLIAGRGAINDVLAGNLVTACFLLRQEWTGLQNMTLEKAQRVFVAHGGKPGAEASPAAAEQPTQASAGPAAPLPPKPPKEAPMGALALLQLFAPILSTMLPQIAPLLGGGDKTNKYAGVAQVVLDTITKTAGSENLQGAIEKMQTEPTVKAAVQAAVVTHPEVIGLMEIGGGIGAAREANLASQNADKPFWFNPAFWVTLLLLPLVYWIVGSVLVGGTEGAWTIFGRSFNEETRSGTVNLVIGMVLGGIVGIWFGTSYGSMRKTELAAQAAK